ncbi:MAG: hypothetical protein QOF58_8944 [Pseudonocardiales bacterium]|nr:hypothetical protein [Pseudonocardiales bacterium]
MSERADVIRNRAAVLTATEALFRQDDRVTLARVAERAGVGKATVLRHFGDLNGLVDAVLAPKVTALRNEVCEGNPPLGPGGSPEERLHAYLDALLDFTLDQRALIRALEHRRPHAYYANPASQFWIAELATRLHDVHPGADTDYLANAVFTALRADVVDYLRTERHMSVDRIRAGVHALASNRPK